MLTPKRQVFARQLKVAGSLDQQDTAYRTHVRHIALLRAQIEAAGPVDGGSDSLLAQRVRLDIEIEALPEMTTNFMQTLKSLKKWDQRAFARRSKFSTTLADMNDRYDECLKLYNEGGKIQEKLDAMEGRLDTLAGIKVGRGYYSEGKWCSQSHDAATAGIGAGGKCMLTTVVGSGCDSGG